jgi:hypothetical protein
MSGIQSIESIARHTQYIDLVMGFPADETSTVVPDAKVFLPTYKGAAACRHRTIN